MESPSEHLHTPFELRSNNYQPNAITESKQEFTEMEKRIVVLAINQLRHVVKAWRPGQNIALLIPYAELTNHHHSKIAMAVNTLNTKCIGGQGFRKRINFVKYLYLNNKWCEIYFDFIIVRSIVISRQAH